MSMDSSITIMLIAFGVESLFGWPDWLYRRIGHPVVWLGAVVTRLEKALNTEAFAIPIRFVLGAAMTLCLISVVAAGAWAIQSTLPATGMGLACQAVLASSLLAARSLRDHVRAVSQPLNTGTIEQARSAVAKIVGRNTSALDAAGIGTAALESLAENTSDGVTAPLFWGVLFGLPGIAAYKTINTLDSMIGHRSARYKAFGAAAARIDDAANIIPARLTGATFALLSANAAAWRAMWRDAGKHASPNAGWPEAAMAGALGVRLGGPRAYVSGAKDGDHAWLNPAGRPVQAEDVNRGLALYGRSLCLFAVTLVLIFIMVRL